MSTSANNHQVALAAIGGPLVITSFDNSVQVANVIEKRITASYKDLPGGDIINMRYHPDDAVVFFLTCGGFAGRLSLQSGRVEFCKKVCTEGCGAMEFVKQRNCLFFYSDSFHPQGSGSIYCYDARSGEKLREQYGYNDISGLIALEQHGMLLAISGGTTWIGGKPWESVSKIKDNLDADNSSGRFKSWGVIVCDRHASLFIGSQNGPVQSVNLDSGKVNFQVEGDTPDGEIRPLALSEQQDVVFCGDGCGHVIAVRADTGHQLFREHVGSGMAKYAFPCESAGILLCLHPVDIGTGLTSLDLRSGQRTLQARVSEHKLQHAVHLARHGCIFCLVVGEPSQFISLDTCSGHQRFSIEVNAQHFSLLPSEMNDVVVVRDAHGIMSVPMALEIMSPIQREEYACIGLAVDQHPIKNFRLVQIVSHRYQAIFWSSDDRSIRGLSKSGRQLCQVMCNFVPTFMALSDRDARLFAATRRATCCL